MGLFYLTWIIGGVDLPFFPNTSPTGAPCILHFPPLYGILSGEPRRFRSDEANLKPKELSTALVIFVPRDAYTTLLFL